MLRRARYLAAFYLACATSLFLVLEGRLFFLQVICHRDQDHFTAYQNGAFQKKGARGSILDRRGGVLAQTTRGVDVHAWTRDIRQPARIAECLNRLTGADPDQVRDQILSEAWPALVKNVCDPKIVRTLEVLTERYEYRALDLKPVYQRTYPQGSLFAPLLGFVDSEGRGQAGLERFLDKVLQAQPVRQEIYRDGRGQVMLAGDVSEAPYRPGITVQLTLEPVIQAMVEKRLDQFVAEFEPLRCQAVVLDPNNGEILALAQRPAPGAGRPGNAEELKLHRLLPAEDSYTPGSTLKPHMMAYVIGQIGLDPGRQIHCGHGRFAFGKRVVHDAHGGYGYLDPADILIHSSNIGIAKLAMSLVDPDVPKGDPQFLPILSYYRSLGFGGSVSGFVGETKGKLTRLGDFTRNYSLVSLAFGHEIAVNLLQMVTATAALINGGIRYSPQLVLSYRDPLTGLTWKQEQARGTSVLQPETSALMRHMLMRVVDEGQTGRHRPRGYSVGGKTGTAEKDHDRSKITPSYFCFGPSRKPRVLVLMMADEPRKGRFASQIVAPTAAQILGDALEFLAVPYDRPEERPAAVLAQE